jgi:hypothetical protein
MAHQAIGMEPRVGAMARGCRTGARHDERGRRGNLSAFCPAYSSRGVSRGGAENLFNQPCMSKPASQPGAASREIASTAFTRASSSESWL